MIQPLAYSLFTTSAGLPLAALNTCPKTVSSTTAITPVSTPANNHPGISVR